MMLMDSERSIVQRTIVHWKAEDESWVTVIRIGSSLHRALIKPRWSQHISWYTTYINRLVVEINRFSLNLMGELLLEGRLGSLEEEKKHISDRIKISQ